MKIDLLQLISVCENTDHKTNGEEHTTHQMEQKSVSPLNSQSRSEEKVNGYASLNSEFEELRVASGTLEVPTPCVLQVEKQYAKLAKDILKKFGWLDFERKVYSQEGGLHICLPVTKEFCRVSEDNQGLGNKLEPLNDQLLKPTFWQIFLKDISASAALNLLMSCGATKRVDEVIKVKKTANSPFKLMQEAVASLLTHHGLPADLIEQLPSRWERLGAIIVLPVTSFKDQVWNSIGEELWPLVAHTLGTQRLARQGRIAQTGTRDSKLEILVGDDGWVQHRENGILYSFDATKCMFSWGNLSEKLRMAHLDCRDQVVVDLFAGIGYFSLPFLVRANAKMVYACEWNPHAIEALRRNLLANALEQGGYTQFTPHYITWYCPEAFTVSKQCKSQCLNHGRYCAPDPEQDFSSGYDGKDVVLENLRQLCVFRVANETKKPWVWWDYVNDFQIRCPMKEKKYGKECADEVIKSLGLDLRKVERCMGDPDADADNPILKEEQEAQIGKGSRGDVTILPTLVVNNRQYRGKLEKGAVLKAICAGFEETTEPSVCLSGEVETNECLNNNGGCWEDKTANVTACKDTFRGRVCECPVVNGVQFKGDGYRSCSASGPGRCRINNGGCWHENRDGVTFSACVDSDDGKCTCPPGFTGDGVKNCEDINECKEKKACQCNECNCKNTWGSYECSCSSSLLYIKDHDTCISKNTTEVKSSWAAVWIILIVLGLAGGVSYVVYKHRLRSYMDSEIRAIMSQYMPLDSQNEVPNHVHEDHA